MGERVRIGLREIRAMAPGAVLWDATVPGLAARRQTGEAVAYVLKYRTAEGRARWHTIGRHGAPWTPDLARAEALRLLGEVVKGADPAEAKQARRHALTVTELCDQYLADAEAGRLLTRRREAKRASTLLSDRGRIERHIKPILGRLAVPAVRREDVERLMHAIAEGETAARTKTGKPRGLSHVRGGRGVATRTIGLLGAIFTYAVAKRLRADNPVRGVMRFADQKRERRLSDDEYAALGAGLRKAEGAIWPPAVACARFLALTGWRSGEALALRWRDVDLVRRVATLPDTKTGRSVRPLARAACDLLTALPRAGDSALVFRATRGDGVMAGFPKLFARLAKLAELPADVTPHVLRHSFASLGGDLGLSEPTIGTLIGHRSGGITARYTHLADAPLLAAADAVARETLARMGEAEPAGAVVPLRAAG